MKSFIYSSLVAASLGIAPFYSDHKNNPVRFTRDVENIGSYYDEAVYKIKEVHPQYSLEKIQSVLTRKKSDNEIALDKILDAETGYSEVVDKLYMKANSRQESTTIIGKDTTFFDSYATSRSGARGLFQFKEDVWPHYGTKNFDDAFDRKKNFDAALKLNLWIENYLSQRDPEWKKLSKKDKRRKIAAAHNGGTGSIRRAGYNIGLMRFESENHACRIDQYYGQYSAEEEILGTFKALALEN